MTSSDSAHKEKLIQILRLPPAKTFHLHEMGLVLAMFLVVFNVYADIVQTHFLNAIELAVLLLFFGYGTYVGGIFASIIVIASIIGRFTGVEFTFQNNGILPAFFSFARWYSVGYLAGMLFPALYNLSIFGFLKKVDKSRMFLSFIYDSAKSVNIIKSPIDKEIQTENQVLSSEKLQRINDYNLNNKPIHPYTILFVANPVLSRPPVKKNYFCKNNNGDFQADPIINDLPLFLRMVDKALNSFESNEVIGRPEIWSRIRVITLFAEELARGENLNKTNVFADKYDRTVEIGGKIITNLLAPAPGMVTMIKRRFRQMLNKNSDPDLRFSEQLWKEIDVIFVLSVSPFYTRSTSLYTDYPDDYGSKPKRIKNKLLKKSKKGRDYTVGIHEQVTANTPIMISDLVNNNSGNKQQKIKHEAYSVYPGRAAINVLSATGKTFVHEFGHAMSSAINGAIVDEYADEIQIISTDKKLFNRADIPLYINRLERSRVKNGKFIPIPKKFMIFNQTEYYSDMEHPSAEEEWKGYFPERFDTHIPCTMDSSMRNHRFDKLISDYIYDRLTAKINRDA